MSDILESIQKDIIDPSIAMSAILMKAKVLAHQLKNETLKQWVKSELDGYPEDLSGLPDYRVIAAQCLAQTISGGYNATDIPIGMSKMPDWFKERANTIKFPVGIRAAEEIAQNGKMVYFPWPPEYIAVWSQANAAELGFQQLIGVKRPVSPQIFAQMVQTVRSRLQDFVLELSDLPWNMDERPLPSEQIEKLVSLTIYNNQGGTMSTFDQRGQQVQSQNNAGRDVNISGGINVTNKAELLKEIQSLRELINQADVSKQSDVRTAIQVLEEASENDDVSKTQVVHAVETLSEVPAMRQHLENLALGATGSLAATGIIEGIKFVLGV